ncbi:MAG: hypothetical protein NC483_00630 [Ruminococcus sp.]|nr:hypothetical protein [Ruminococcus sp.]
MLKIKDNVDLKELEKFGFSYTLGEDWHIYFDNTSISLGDNREIFINLNDMDFCEEDEIFKIIHLLYDIIKANLVEKVSDEENM